VDFAGSDAPVSAAGLEKFERIGVQVPATAGMIALVYNVPGLKGVQLKLPRSVYLDIFLGKIRHWDDARIAAANPDLHMPHMDIAVIGRLDSSGTTYQFTNHLAAVDPSWSESGPGVGRIVSWPRVAMLARGNEGVAARIEISQGGIGYVEYGLAKRLGLPMASLENKDGQFVAPSPEAAVAALRGSAGLGLEKLAASVLDPVGAEAYPIVTYSWLMLHRSYPAEQGRAMRAFVDFALGEGQEMSSALGYIALPPTLANLGKAAAANILPGEAAATAPTTSAASDKPATPATTPTSPAAPAPLAASPTLAESYTVSAGDTFKSVAVKLYRDANRWRDIAAANPQIDPRRRLRAGQTLRLPEPVEAGGGRRP
jgi:phosphate transport system substrate-binding protein